MPQDAVQATSTGRPRTHSGIDAGYDRAAAFRKAKRHTIAVRLLRAVLPVTAVAMFASYGLFMQRTLSFNVGKGKVEITGLEINREALVAKDPRYTGFDKNGGEFEVRAATAEQDLKQRGFVRLKTIDGKMLDVSRQVTTMKAVRGTLDTNTNVLEMYEKIDVAAYNGMTAELTRATVYTKENRIVSDEPVTVRMPTGTVRGQAMTIEQKQRTVLFTDGVVANFKAQPKAATAPPIDPAFRTSQAPAGPAGKDAPVDITSKRLLIDDNTKLATFSGQVVARQIDQVLETAVLEVSYEGQPQAGGEAALKSSTPDGSGRLRRLEAKSDVVLTRGVERATGSSAVFDAITDRATLMGPVVIQAGPDRGATADRADIDNKNDTILLTGNVVVTQQKNVLKGRLLNANRKLGTMQVSAPAMNSVPKGQISAKLYQAESDAPAKKGAPTTKAAAAGTAATPAGGMLNGNLRGDPSQPIDIDADTLDVDDKKKTATFKGRVKAVQGEYVINTDELIATYEGDAGMALGPQPAGAATATAAAQQPKTGAQLKQIISPRKVLIVAKDGQRATGNSAVFDPKTNMARLSGDVTLSRGEASTQGACALLDMNSGLMKIVDACGFAASASSAPGAAAGSAASLIKSPQPARAQALFYPGKMQEEQKAQRDNAKGTAPATATPSAAPRTAAPSTPAAAPATPAPPAPRPAARPARDDLPAGFGN